MRLLRTSKRMAMITVRWLLFSAVSIVVSVLPTTGRAQGVAASATKVLADRCLSCHNTTVRLGGLDLSTAAGFKAGGKHGSAARGKAATSLIYKRITAPNGEQMPPADRLTPQQISTIKSWLDAGAAFAGSAPPAPAGGASGWWAFRKPVLPPVPGVARVAPVTFPIRNPIDAFVLAKLKKQGLVPSAAADRKTLLRRVTFDITGLPPTPEEAVAFLADKRPDAYERLVDRLLFTPAYGERWARHWLDIVRYADSGGFEGDRDRPLAFKYRDFVVNAFNRDMPYDQFVKLQVAGDEMKLNADAAREGIVATGFLACGPVDIVMINDQNRANELDDIVSTTGGAFLGLTLGCARCHDHKYDPITQKDYYRLSAVFAPSERREIDVPTDNERKAADEANARLDTKLAPLLAELAPITAAATAACHLAGLAAPNPEQLAMHVPTESFKRYSELSKDIAELEKTRASLPKAMAVTDRSATFPPSHLLIRGEASRPGEEVKPGFICSLPGGNVDLGAAPPGATSTGRRLALADWLTKDNPLLARVWVNRVWRQHFGHGIVDTPSNFGISGQLPSHPELLDWLAVTFESNGWSTRKLHRMILLSSAYRQASSIRQAPQAVDPQNRLLWRMPVRRLEAEAIRDTVLAVSGALNRSTGGPAVYPPVDPTLRADTFQGPNWQDGEDGPSTWRRSIYVKVKRSLLLPELEVFDCPEITNSVAARSITTTPTQALTLLNGPFANRQAVLFAERVNKEAGSDAAAQVKRVFSLAFNRLPSVAELADCRAFMAKRGEGLAPLTSLCHAVLNMNEFVYVD